MALFTKKHDNEDFIVLGMYLMIASDADIDDREEEGIKMILKSLPRFKDIDLNELLYDAKSFIINNGYKESFEEFKKIKNEDLKKTIIPLAIEAAMLDHIIVDTEEDVIVDLASAMELPEETLGQAVDVISWKYSLEEI